MPSSGEEYRKGAMLTGEIKAVLIKVLSDIVTTHQVITSVRHYVSRDDLPRVDALRSRMRW